MRAAAATEANSQGGKEAEAEAEAEDEAEGEGVGECGEGSAAVAAAAVAEEEAVARRPAIRHQQQHKGHPDDNGSGSFATATRRHSMA